MRVRVLISIIDYFRQSISELQKVVWPTRSEVVRHTLIILISVVVAMIVVAAIDYGFDLIVNQYLLK